MAEELQVSQTPPYWERAALSDEYIDVFITLWTSERSSYDGNYCRFDEVAFEPLPAHQTHLSIWFGDENRLSQKVA